jgi:hypothetical protein
MHKAPEAVAAEQFRLDGWQVGTGAVTVLTMRRVRDHFIVSGPDIASGVRPSPARKDRDRDDVAGDHTPPG